MTLIRDPRPNSLPFSRDYTERPENWQQMEFAMQCVSEARPEKVDLLSGFLFFGWCPLGPDSEEYGENKKNRIDPRGELQK